MTTPEVQPRVKETVKGWFLRRLHRYAQAEKVDEEKAEWREERKKMNWFQGGAS